MTTKELEQLQYLKQEIEEETLRLEELRADATAPAVVKITGLPKVKGFESHVERYTVKIAQLEAVIADKIEHCIDERLRLEKYIADIPDSLTRQVFVLRFVKGFNWIKVGQLLRMTEDCARMICNRYIKKNK